MAARPGSDRSLYLPWLLVARATLTGYTGNGDSPDFFAMGLRSLSVFAVGESVPAIQQGLYALLAALLVSIGVGRLVLASGKGRRALFLLSLIFLAPLLLTWLGALDRPIFNERYLVTVLPGFLLLIAAGALPSLMTPDARSTAGRRAAHAAHSALVAALVVACAYALAHHYADPIFSKTRGWRHSASLLERYSAGWHAQQTRVAQTYPDPTLWYYYQERADHLVLPPAADDETGASRVVAALAEEGVARVVILAQPSEAWDPHDSASRTLARHYALTADIPLGDVRIRVYDRPPAILPGTDSAFANGVRLTAAAIPTQRLVAGDIVPVYLRWQGQADVLLGQEKITLQLLDASGKLVAQTDHPFGTAELAAPVTSYTIATPRELASGAYRLIAAIYDPGRPGAPRWLAATGADLLDLAQLSTQ